MSSQLVHIGQSVKTRILDNMWSFAAFSYQERLKISILDILDRKMKQMKRIHSTGTIMIIDGPHFTLGSFFLPTKRLLMLQS